ncbi:MAG: hypothetical protein BBJ57_05180 [Desulfobacterales bacterium PC51MH44]|nr:MAG: hypothetical protein BBJ57_05180 [Desulfobacterales bacterium PC51MH44]
MRYFQVIGCTVKGPVREANEDHILVGRFVKNGGRLGIYFDHDDDFLTNYGLLFAVADGVGGASGGAMASKLALTAIERQFYGVEKAGKRVDDFADMIRSAAIRANETILKVGSSKPDLSGMGSTISGVCLTPYGYLVFNAGDSRVYRFRNGVLKPLTRDDSLTTLAVEAGHMSLAEAQASEARHTLTNCLGSTSFKITVNPGPELRDNDILLICSDGLHDLVPHERLEELLLSSQDMENLIGSLCNEAVINGGHDNISIILVRSDILEEEENIKEPEGQVSEAVE